jgi:tetratricopeptide (TPR) repeat protein
LSSSGRGAEAAPYLQRAREDQKRSLSEVQQFVADKAVDAGFVSAAAVVAVIKSQEDQPVADWSKPVDPSLPLDPAILERAGLSQEKKQAAIKDESDLRLVIASGLSDLAISKAIQHNYAGALGYFQEAERWSPAVPDLQRNLGIAAFRAQNYPECVRALSEVLATHPLDNVVRAMLGSAYFGMEDYRGAVRTIAPLADRATHDATLGYAWAASLARMGEFKQATDILAEYEKQSLSLDAVFLVGQLWSDMEDYSRAVQAFHRVLDIDPTIARAHYFSGLAQLHWEHGAEAVEEFNAALKLAPDDPDVKVGLGYILMQQGKQAEAIEVFRSIVAAHPENGNAEYQLGKLLLDGGKAKEAVSHLEAAARVMPQSDYVHYQLQGAYRKESRTADADRELQIYKELKAKHREATVPRPIEGP